MLLIFDLSSFFLFLFFINIKKEKNERKISIKIKQPKKIRKPAGGLGVVSPCERSENRGGVGERGCEHRGLKTQNLLVIRDKSRFCTPLYH